MKNFSKTQKIILFLTTLFVIFVGGVCLFALKSAKLANATADTIYEKVPRKNPMVNADIPVNFSATEPFSMLLLGVDTGDLGRTEQGRSDTMMVVTVNPVTKQTTLLSLDRDIYTKIVGHGTYDKLNHAYAFGDVAMAMDSVEALLDIPLHHYLTINMEGFSDLVDAIGGIKVSNQYHFELDGVELLPGEYTLTGREALSYARYRKYDSKTQMGDPNGDMGRQNRQREVVSLMAKKILSFNSLSSYKNILKAVKENTKTDLTWESILQIIQGYTKATENIVSIQLEGEGVMIDNIYYQKLEENNLLTIQNTLKTQLNLPRSDTLKNENDAYNQFYEGAV